MHDKIFADQRGMAPEKYLDYAREIGLDVDRFKRDSESETIKSRLAQDSQEASTLGVTGTPAFFVNGKYLSGAQPFEQFKAIIDAELSGG
jgi:protein-disulfide isomerase